MTTEQKIIRALLAYRENPSFFAVGEKLGVHHQTVQRCVERALAYGALAALDDRPRPGKEPTITPEAKAWWVSLACDKAEEHGYAHELWTTRLLARHARTGGGARMPRPPGARHSVQDPRPRGNQAAKGALLSATPRRRVRAEDGRSSVCLPRGFKC
jgi:transposase